MDFSRFTEKLQEAVRAAQSGALSLGHQQVDVEHLFSALLEQENGLAASILLKANLNLERIHTRLQDELGRLPKVTLQGAAPDHVYLTGRLQKLFLAAEQEAKKLKDEYVSVEHLLLALTEDNGASGRLLKEFRLSRETLMKVLQEVRGSQRVTSPTPESTYQALERYGRDLTALANQGKLDPVIGRDEEIR
ncbi:MAG: type VI secretion system ATPase TssH, partial [Acidobacteriia bacterium]|nr:type VI secretion system ATPase TssH [Terriglobia bacterium]